MFFIRIVSFFIYMLTLEKFRELMDVPGCDFRLQGKLAVAVSGGPDSLVLAHLLWRWAAEGPKRPEIHVLCVDHGLRAESGDEARHVHDVCSAWGDGVVASILRWRHDGVQERVQEAARAARYKLLSDYCADRGIRFLFLGHHLDDQAETVLFRLAKGSGLDGLSAMRPLQVYDGDLTLVRPMLEIPKAELLVYAQAQGLAYLNDPSNESEKFARVRLRRSWGVLEEEGLSASRLGVTAERMARAKDALDFYCDLAYKEAVLSINTSQIVLKFDILKKHPSEIVLRAVLRAMATLVPFSGYPPRMEKVEALVRDLMCVDPFRKRTLGGVVFERDDASGVLIFRPEHEDVLGSK